MATGDVLVESRYKPGAKKVAMMPRFGTELVAAPGLENITWYGRGPKETMSTASSSASASTRAP